MKTNKYWSKRFELLTESLFYKGESYYEDLEREYNKAISSIQRDIRDFYGRYGEDITFADTKKLLTPREIREFKDNIGSYIDMEDRQKVSRLHSLQYQIQQQVDMVSAIRLKSLTKLSEEIVKEGYYRSIYEIQKGFGIGDTFNIIDTKLVESIISKPWAPDGSNFSKRIWRDRDVLMDQLQTELAQSFIRGDGPDNAIRNISKKMEVSKRAAGRLIMTESAFFANEARARAFKELGVEEYQFMATLDMRTSDICQDMDLRIFKLSEREIGVNWSPLHVLCRSTQAPYFKDNVIERWARDPSTGKGYKVPGNMNYKDWHKKYVG